MTNSRSGARDGGRERPRGSTRSRRAHRTPSREVDAAHLGSSLHPVVLFCIAYAAFLVLSVLWYRGLWKNLFYKDDYLWMSIAQDVAQAPWRLLVFESDNAAAGVRVVQRALFGALYAGFGMNAAAYHVASILLHALNSTLVFGLLRRLLRDVAGLGTKLRLALAAFGALLFATTSLHAAAVIWLSAMSSLLVTASTIILFRYVLAHEERLGEWRVCCVGLGLFTFALACKNTAVGFPLVVAPYLLWLSARRDVGSGRRRFAIALAIVGVACVIVTKLVVGRVGISAAFGGTGAYAVGTNVPLNLLGACMGTLISARMYEWLLPGLPYPYVAVPLLLVAVAAVRRLPEARLGWLGVVWLLASALPVSLFDYQQYSGEQIMVTRYYYAPLVGTCILYVVLLSAMSRAVRGAGRTGLLLALVAAAHGALHLSALRRQIGEIEAYGASRQLLFDSTWDAVKNRLGARTEVYAAGWPVPREQLPHIGRHFFTPRGIALRPADDLADFGDTLPNDGVTRFLAQWDAHASMLTVRPLRGPRSP